MIYAKCIREKQVAKTVDEFNKRSGEEHNVYCVGETTYSSNGENLCCVPLNLIYDCLKYGMKIGIVEEDSRKPYTAGCPTQQQIDKDKQKIVNIMPADSKRQLILYLMRSVTHQLLVMDISVFCLKKTKSIFLKS